MVMQIKHLALVLLLNFKTCCFAPIAVGISLLYLPFFLSLSQFQSGFESFLHVSAVLCRRLPILRDLSTYSLGTSKMILTSGDSVFVSMATI